MIDMVELILWIKTVSHKEDFVMFIMFMFIY
jgi:hypothetical protein